jgi:hypothetical protein
MIASNATTNSIGLGKTQHAGLRGDNGVFWWRDILGSINPNSAGAAAPTLDTWRGNCRRYYYAANDRVDAEIHVPHNWVNGSNLYLHWHWGHSGTAISGNFVFNITMEHTMGHLRGVGSSTLLNLTAPTTALAAKPNAGQFYCDIPDFLIGQAGGGVNLIDTSLILPDDSLAFSFIATTIPTISGGVRNQPVVWNIDLHAQTTGFDATPNKDPSGGSFWA